MTLTNYYPLQTWHNPNHYILPRNLVFISSVPLPLSLPWSSSLSSHPPEPQEAAHTLSRPIRDRQVWTILLSSAIPVNLFSAIKGKHSGRRSFLPSSSKVTYLHSRCKIHIHACYKPVKPDSSFPEQWLKKNICLLWKWQAMHTEIWLIKKAK